MFDKLLIEHCSPTLAAIKTGSLFSLLKKEDESILYYIDLRNRELNPKGVHIVPLYESRNRCLIYVYRPDRLISDLQQQGVSEFLKLYGYPCYAVSQADNRGKLPQQLLDLFLYHLQERCTNPWEFPHEIGLFLGYPLHDVEGFITNQGLHARCSGCWKVYDNEMEAQRLFSKFKKCTKVYTGLFLKGRSVLQLTVAA